VGCVQAPQLHLSLPVVDLADAAAFYRGAFGCEIGRERDDWVDVWFFGLQLTLQRRPHEVLSADEQGVRHFGVSLSDRAEFEEVIHRLSRWGARWISAPRASGDAELSGKVSAKVADPSGNVIEIKHYPGGLSAR
jgi:extradiol dioxygenase family protein